jgi:multiple sugar transport system permease protein
VSGRNGGAPLHYLALVALAAIALGPIVIMVATSLKTQAQIFSPVAEWLFLPTLSNYAAVLDQDRFDRYLANSLIVSLISTAITLAFGAMCAYALARFQFMGRMTLGLSTLILRTLPPAVLAVPVFVLWSAWGLTNAYGGVILAYVALNLPFTIWLLYGFIEQVPEELEEAAAVDGCSPLTVFWHIVLPLITPGLAAAAIFTFRLAWNEFILALVLTNRHTRTLPVAASLYITDVGIEWGKIMAVGALIALPPLVFTFVAARQIITGLTEGAVKG